MSIKVLFKKNLQKGQRSKTAQICGQKLEKLTFILNLDVPSNFITLSTLKTTDASLRQLLQLNACRALPVYRFES